MNNKDQIKEERLKNIKQRFPELFKDNENQKKFLLASPIFSEELDYKHQTASNMFFNTHAKTRTFIEKYEGEAYTHNLKKKIDEKFCSIDKLLSKNGGVKLDIKFKGEIKNLIVQIHGIARRNKEFLRLLNPNKDECSFHVNLKYLFLSVVYLKLKSDLYENIGNHGVEIGLSEIVKAYGSQEICMGKLGNYIDFVKTIVQEFGIEIKLKISKEDKKNLTFYYLDMFTNLCLDVIKASPNYSEFNMKKLKRVYKKIFENFEAKFDCVKGKRIRHFACAIFHISLRLLDVNLTLIELIGIMKKEEEFNNMVYYSITRVIREICDEFIDKFIQLLLKFKKNRIFITSKLGNFTWVLNVYEPKIEELLSKNRVNIKSKEILEIMKFCLKGKIIKIMKELDVSKNLHLKDKRKEIDDESVLFLGKRSSERREYEEASTAEFFFKEEDRISSFSGYLL